MNVAKSSTYALLSLIAVKSAHAVARQPLIVTAPIDVDRPVSTASPKVLCHVSSVEAKRVGLLVRFEPPVPNAAVTEAGKATFKSAGSIPIRAIVIPYGGRAMTSHIANSQCLIVAVSDSDRRGVSVSYGFSGPVGPGIATAEFVPATSKKQGASKGN